MTRIQHLAVLFLGSLMVMGGLGTEVHAGEAGGGQDLSGELAAIRDILSADIPGLQNNLTLRLDKIQVDLDRILHPVWEYKIVVPNLLNSSGGPEEGVWDGVDFPGLGQDGWELVNYSANYGFIFKRQAR